MNCTLRKLYRMEIYWTECIITHCANLRVFYIIYTVQNNLRKRKTVKIFLVALQAVSILLIVQIQDYSGKFV